MAAPMSQRVSSQGCSSEIHRGRSTFAQAGTVNAHRSYIVDRHRNTQCSAKIQRKEVALYDYWDRIVPYEQAWSLQHRLLEEVQAGMHGVGAVILLQHSPVYTLGAGSTIDHLRFDPSNPPHPLFRTERGGEVTYHGPGQLVMYPILDLKQLTQDLHWYLRSLEEVAIRALEAVSGIEGKREPGRTGVWVDGRKLAAIGVRARRWVTCHGLALNVAPDLGPFSSIVPCGIAGREVGSVWEASREAEDDRQDSSIQAQQAQLLREYAVALLEAAEDVFVMRLVPGEEPLKALTAPVWLEECRMGKC
ncbi:LPL2 [Auxenochlorella protothecoides x Auxenochlorella symbiontica]